MRDADCTAFLQQVLPRLRLRWAGFRRVRRQVCDRLGRRLRELGLSDLAAYRVYLEAHAEEWARLDALCRIPISRFWRDRAVFDHLRDAVLPALASGVQAAGGGPLRCWSAGCASGEEPYSLALAWTFGAAARFPSVELRVLATDADPALLERARRACYRSSSLRNLPPEWVAQAFSHAGDELCLRPDLRRPVELHLQDIRQELPREQFHLLLCRNLVFTYFEPELQRELLTRLLAHLRPGGVLLLGRREALPDPAPPTLVAESDLGSWRRRPEPEAPPAAV